MPDPPHPLTDVRAGDWIAPRLGPFGTAVGGVVLRGFAAYARVLHPAPTDPPTTWAAVCAVTGATPHALMQWSAITRGGRGDDATIGNLEAPTLCDLCAVLEPHGPWTQSPSLFWPSDRSWCVATEIDLDSTLVGGPAELVDAVLAAPDLETWPIGVDDSLAADGDTINR